MAVASSADNLAHLDRYREIARRLARLAGAGLVPVLAVGGKKLYQANRASPVFDELVGLIAKLSEPPAPVVRAPAASYEVARPPAAPAGARQSPRPTG